MQNFKNEIHKLKINMQVDTFKSQDSDQGVTGDIPIESGTGLAGLQEMFMSAIGTSQNYKYSTEAFYQCDSTNAKLAYSESRALGLSGGSVNMYFAKDVASRNILVLERTNEHIKLIISNGTTLNHFNMHGFSIELCVVTRHFENTVTEEGGHLLLDFDIVAMGYFSLRWRIEIDALPSNDDSIPSPLLYIAKSNR